MKPQQYALILLFLFFSIHQKTMAQTIREQLIGSWIFDYDVSLEKMEAKVKIRFNNMPQEKQSKIENAYRGRVITFESNGNYIQILADGRNVLGTWTLDDISRTVTIKNTKNKENKLKIENLTPTRLSLKPLVHAKNKPLFVEWHYNLKSRNDD